MKKPGTEVTLYAPRMALDVQKFLNSYAYGREAYVRIESDQAVLYLVTRATGRHQVGTIHAGMTIPILQEV